MKAYSTIEAIKFLHHNKDQVFVRINDEKFELFRGNYGDIMMRIENMVKPLPIFNYYHDYWKLK